MFEGRITLDDDFLNDMQGLFGNMFDLNHDGKLDNAERAADLAAFTTIMDEDEEDDDKRNLELSGLDEDELEADAARGEQELEPVELRPAERPGPAVVAGAGGREPVRVEDDEECVAPLPGVDALPGADDRLAAAVLSHESAAQRLGIAGAQFEDVPQLDPARNLHAKPAVRAGIPLPG